MCCGWEVSRPYCPQKFPKEEPYAPERPSSLLRKARQRFTQRDLATRLKVAPKTVARWERGETPCPAMLEPALREIMQGLPVLVSENDNRRFTFIDLFAGIGGIRLGFESAGGECVITSEWNEWSKKTYLANYGDGHPFIGDIVPYPDEEIPDHDVLLGGFPCQPFSIAGVSKKNALGRPHGFECTTQGTLFFDVARIIAAKRPKAFMLENVKNLLSHDKGNTFRIILETLRNELGYEVHSRIIDARSLGAAAPRTDHNCGVQGQDRLFMGRSPHATARTESLPPSCTRRTAAKAPRIPTPLVPWRKYIANIR